MLVWLILLRWTAWTLLGNSLYPQLLRSKEARMLQWRQPWRTQAPGPIDQWSYYVFFPAKFIKCFLSRHNLRANLHIKAQHETVQVFKSPARTDHAANTWKQSLLLPREISGEDRNQARETLASEGAGLKEKWKPLQLLAREGARVASWALPVISQCLTPSF